MISATVLCGCGNIEIPVESEVTSTSVNVIESETVIEENSAAVVDLGALEDRYCFFADGIFGVPDTITDARVSKYRFGEQSTQFEKLYKSENGKFISERPPFLYYAVQNLGITEEELLEYIVGVEQFEYTKGMYIPENTIEALMSKDLNYTKSILKSPLAIYSDGNIYNTYELLEMSDENLKSLNVTEEDAENYVKNMKLYFEVNKNIDSNYIELKKNVDNLMFCMLSCSDINIDKASDESLEVETVTSETKKVIEETVTEAEKIEEFVEATEVDYDMEFDEYVDSRYKDIGGEHMGDELFGLYIGYVDTMLFYDTTLDSFDFDEYAKLTQEYEQYYRDATTMSGYSLARPPLLYYCVKKLNLTQADINTYNNVRGLVNLPQKMIDSLFLEDENEAKKVFKSPYVLYSDGKIYNVYEVMRLKDDEISSLKVTQDEMKEFIDNISNYIERCKKSNVNIMDIQYDAVDDFIQQLKNTYN